MFILHLSTHLPSCHLLIPSYISKLLSEEYLLAFPFVGDCWGEFSQLENIYFSQSENAFTSYLSLKGIFAGEF